MMNDKTKILGSAIIPVVLLLILLFFFIKLGPLGIFKSDLPPIEKIFIERFVLEPEQIYVHIINDGPDPVTISQVSINEVFWKHEITPDNFLSPAKKATIKLNYPWIEGDPYSITIFASDGITFNGEIGVATETPKFSWLFFKTFLLLGLYVGVIPVILGLLWFPFLTMLRGKWYDFLLSFTIGLLVFLGFSTLEESFELAGSLPNILNGIGVLVIGFFLAILVLSSITYKTDSLSKNKGEHFKSLVWGYLIALGIGIHNLGEGLAIGSAYAIGEIALGGMLVIGFMIHNVTEGIAIVSPLTRSFKDIKNIVTHLILLGLIAGVPTIIGTLIGGFSYSPLLGVLFLAIGSGAIFDVAFDILHHMAKGKWISLFSISNVIGFLIGLLVIYFTGFLVIG